MKIILTCEHGGNEIPKKYATYFKNREAVLKTHRGFDLGALDVFKHLKSLAEASFFSKTSRLLIELNRSLHHKNLFSEFSKSLSKEEKLEVIKEYTSYRNSVENAVQQLIYNKETVVHISVHSFTPVLNSAERNCDIGLLFDSRKTKEKEFCKLLKSEIIRKESTLKVRYNYPYLGKADGFTTSLRKQFPENYLGIEIEINQKFSNTNIMSDFMKQTVFKAINSLKGFK
jgi:predicted N-formylglutamate amidohydrolase